DLGNQYCQKIVPAVFTVIPISCEYAPYNSIPPTPLKKGGEELELLQVLGKTVSKTRQDFPCSL
ncbi:MAG TPA: hypothetical protein V6C95_14850, partial [Coleofasciculaceae cyanobacterium]